MKKKLVILTALVAAGAAFFVLGLDRFLSFDGMKAGLGQVTALRDQEPMLTAAVFFFAYVVVAALSLPGAAIMTLAAGAIFGLFWGTVIASVASSIGALVAFLAARTLFRDLVLQRFGDRLAAINRGVAAEGAFYLFTLRLVPAFPFFLINLLMGLTHMPAFTFYWVSQVGMLAGTVVYVNAGTELARLSSPAGILSPGLIVSFALLGLFPWLAKAGLAFWRRQQVYQRWRRPKQYDYNLVVIGAGAGGLVTSYIGAAVKAKVALIEARQMGGDCLNTGCVPSKALIRSAKLAHQMRHGDRYGLAPVNPAVSFRQVLGRVRAVIDAIAPHDSVERYEGLGVDVFKGYGTLVDPWTVEVTNDDGTIARLTTRSIVIATGSRPTVPALPGLEEVGCLTSDTLWAALERMDAPPRRLVVLGGGPIGCELSQALARLGSQVTIVEMAQQLLGREDPEVSEAARQALAAEGITVLTGYRALGCELTGDDKALLVEANGERHRLPFDAILCAVGRTPRLKGYGLEKLGIATDRIVVTNAYLETLYPNIYAVGDVAGPYQFTHTAAHQAWYAAVNALFGQVRKFKADYSVIPWVTFTDPEIARVGLNEREAMDRAIAYEVTRFELNELDRAITEGDAGGFIKVLTMPGKDRILGVTIVGAHAGEMLSEFVLAMRWRLGLGKILSTVHAYPTWMEAVKYTAGAWKKAHAPERLLTLLERYHAWRRRQA